MSEAMPLRTIQQTARGSETYLMLIRAPTILWMPRSFRHPSFAVINEGFGSNTKTLGGILSWNKMKHWQRELPCVCREKCLRSNHTPAERICLNWHALQRYGISATGLPEEYTVMYIPFFVRYRSLLISGFLLASFLSSPSLLSLYIAYAMNGDGNGRLCVRSGMSTRLLNLLSKEA